MDKKNQVSIKPLLGGIALMGLLLGVTTALSAKEKEVSVEKGKGIYQRLCTACHGKTGKGDGFALFEPPPADLTASAIQKKTDEVLLESIRNGHPDTAMGTWKYALSEQEIREVLMYIRQFGRD